MAAQNVSQTNLGAKLRPVIVKPPKKRIRLRKILQRHFVFKNFIKIFFMYLNTYRSMYAKPNFNIFIHFYLMKSIKWSFISCSQGRIKIHQFFYILKVSKKKCKFRYIEGFMLEFSTKVKFRPQIFYIDCELSEIEQLV